MSKNPLYETFAMQLREAREDRLIAPETIAAKLGLPVAVSAVTGTKKPPAV